MGATPAFTGVLTYHNDNLRTGRNSSETSLTLANVNSTTFGKLFVIPTDGKVDAQPLYVPNVSIPGNGAHNVLFVASEHGTVYGFDADSGSTLWHRTTLATGESPSDNRGCSQVAPEIGVTSTPVIDLTAGPHGTIYVVAMSKNSASQYHQRLHALDITTGIEEFGGPVDVAAKYPGTGDNSQGGFVIFDPKQYKERAGLLLLNHILYTSWASHCDFRPYTGWIISYNQTTLKQQSVLNLTPNGSEGAIWAAGAAPAADSNGSIYFLLANGTFDTTLNAKGFPENGDYGNAIMKLSFKNSLLAVADYFNMFNTVSESNADQDLGSGGAMVVPAFKDSTGVLHYLVVGAGKDAHIYLANRTNMGKFNPNNNNQLYQQVNGALGGSVFSAPAFAKGRIYYGAVGDAIKAFSFNTSGRLNSTPASATSTTFPYPGATPSISGSTAKNLILWATENTSPAVLHAYSANNLGVELYNSNQAAGGRDNFGNGNKFITPTIANGKVYVGTTKGVGVFGLLP
ncbi:MAG: pyrrolo-quinoline quinone [Acidobacteriia bacterium]|nr:pyrrolo-quinoline quinone [Terriglobia bacterium]